MFTPDDRHRSMLDTIAQTAEFLKDGNERQAQFWAGIREAAQAVPVVSAYDVWTKEYVDRVLIPTIRPKKKQCYRTAALAARVAGIEYVEGQMWSVLLGCEHAFNYVPDKGVYVDLTAEFALRENPADGAYIALRKWSSKEVWKYIAANGFYGSIYGEAWAAEHREK